MKRIEAIWFPEEIKSIWMITVELSNVASVGGLGNAVYNMAKGLAEQGINVTVIMPSHGRHLNDQYRSALKLRELSLTAYGDRIGMDGKRYPYALGFEEGRLDGFNVILVKGLDYNTGVLIDSWNVYDNIMEKSALLARGVEAYSVFSIPGNIPSVIHAHDWHAVLAGVMAKQTFETRKIVVPLVFTIHLLNKVGAPWHYASEDWAGLSNCPHYIWQVVSHKLYTTRQVWDELSQGLIEKFGAWEADVVTTVSKSYLTYDVYNFIGNWIENKSCVTYNGTDWSINEVKNYARKIFSTEDRVEVRRRLYNMLENLRLIPEDYTTGNILWNNRFRIGIKDDWTYTRLDDGPLVLFAGRLVYQKGVDLLIRAFREVVNKIPNARLVILGLPSGDYGLLYDLINKASEIGGNVRIIASYSMPRDIYKLFYYAASVFVVPSRWEPFGIVALEAMAVGTPVVAYAVGGLRESIIDLRSDINNGTGFIIEPENIWELYRGILTSLALSMSSETKNKNYLYMDDLILKTDNIDLWNKVRQNGIKRVEENFRWSATAKYLINCYSKAQTMAKYRASASF
ncbi:glycosyltransferase [Sulfurisphaera ohwakuensis]|uniref:glycosyltransferase n=1 Tax=Sulfurisphaera ohwakuensis TaxID=69656 RepID=UPI0036F44971